MLRDRTDLQPVEWSQIDAALNEVLPLEPEDQATAMAQLADQQPRLAEEVAALLATMAESRDLLAEAVSEALERSVSSDSMPTAIGPYRPIREVGRGGMGIVYLAERNDAEYHQRVAVKLLKRGLETAEFLRRLRQERQILAGLEHPSIPRLLGGGSTDSGQPYLAMEFVDGRPIDIFCDQSRLNIEQRLRLFIQVCHAVQYAHGQLIVHRDLKPANLLVTTAGEPKLLDFGIAKILDNAAWPHTRAQTHHGIRLLTPEYASPEQLAGESLSTATDIYSLGVVLRLLLLGNDEARKGSQEVASLRQTTVKRLQRLLRGDLENIVAKTLQPEATRRYGSVQELADDVRRFLEDRPITARREAWTYRARKFVIRHRSLVGVAVLLISSLVAGLVSTTWQARRALQQQTRAEHFLEMLVDASSAADPWSRPGEVVPVDQVLDDWTHQLRTWMQQYPTDRAQVLETIGRVFLHQGRLDEADEALSTALVERSNIHGPDHPSLSQSLAALAEVRFIRGQSQAAELLARRALTLRQGAKNEVDIAESQNDLAVILEAQGRSDEALKHYQQALTMRLRLHGQDHAATANSLANLGTLFFHRGDLEAAEEYLRRAVIRLEQVYGPAHPVATKHRANLASVLQQLGKLAEAEALLRSALDSQLQVLGEEHSQVAHSRVNLALVLSRSGHFEDAESLLRAAILSLQAWAGEHHPLVAESALHLADLRFRRGDPGEAESLYRSAISIWQAHANSRPADRRRGLGRLADLLRQQERHAEAVPLYRQLLAIESSVEGAAFDRSRWLMALGESLNALGFHDEARMVVEDTLCLQRHQGMDPTVALDWLTRHAERIRSSDP